MRRGGAAALLGLLCLLGACEKSPDESLLHRTPTPLVTPAPTVPLTDGVSMTGGLDVSLKPGVIQPTRLLLLVDRSVAASFSLEPMKLALSQLVDRLPPDLPLGLRIFPGGNGEASELLWPVGTDDRMALKVKILEMTPAGTGSFSQALLGAASDFVGAGLDNRIVLIAPPVKDSAPERDPCATARALHRMAEKIRVDVVETTPSYLGISFPGFSPGSIACIAAEGGGRFVQVSDPGQVDTAVWSLIEMVHSNIVITASTSNGNPLEGDSKQMGSVWGATLYPSESLTPLRSSSSFPVNWAVPAGDYSLRLWYREISGTVNNLVLAQGKPMTIDVKLHAATLSARVFDSEGVEIVGDYNSLGCPYRWEIFAEGRDSPVATGCSFPITAVVRAGKGRVRTFSDRDGLWEEEIETVEGETLMRQLNYRPGGLELRVTQGGIEQVGGRPECGWRIDLFRSGSGTPLVSRCQFPAKFLVPPGTYDVAVWMEGRAVLRPGVEVAEGKTELLILPLEEGEKKGDEPF